MAALGTFTSAADVEEVVPTELIPNFIANFEYGARIGMGIVWSKPGQGSIVNRFPRFNAVTVPAGTKTESDTFSDTEIDTTESSITPGLVGFRFPISDEMAVHSGIHPMALTEAMNALLDRIDTDVLAATTSLTSTAGAVTDEYTLTRFKSDLSAYRALNIPGAGPVALVLHENGASDLVNSLTSTAAVFAKDSGDTLAVGTSQGFIGSLHGVSVYSSPNVATESTGHSGVMTPIGDMRCGLAIVLQEMPRVVSTRGDEAENRAVTFWHFRAWYGAGVANPRRALEILHQ